MVREYSFSFDNLEIKYDDLALLLGFEDGVIPEDFIPLIDEAIDTAPALCNFRGGFVIFDEIEINNQNHTIRIDNQLFNPPKIVTTQFKQASALAVFACTAGSEISEMSRRELESGDPFLGLILDTIGSVSVDRATEKLQQILASEMLLAGNGISDRFSPGYCEWSVAEQQKLFALLPSGFCGITLSESSLMSPIKSVSGFIAIGKDLKQKGYQCHWCTDENCIYGKIKRKKTI